MGSTHSGRLENWIGSEQVEAISRNMRGWYGPPIAIGNVPGHIYACGDGDFVGVIRGGGFADMRDFAEQRVKRILRNVNRKQRSQMNTGFASLSDLINEATAGGKLQDPWFSKAGAGTVSPGFYSLWAVGTYPAAGSAPATRPGGAAPTNATTGAIPFTDPGGADTLHLCTVQSQGSTAPNTLLLYDRTFGAGAVSATSTSAQSVTGVPTRYATTTSPGVFAFAEVTTLLGGTASNLTMQYTDQAGNSAENAPVVAMTINAAVGRLPHPNFFIPLNAGDTGLRTITNLTLSASMVAGVFNICQGRPLLMIPQPVANSMVVMDGINSAFNIKQILAGACLSMLELKGVASATTYTGTLTMVAG